MRWLEYPVKSATHKRTNHEIDAKKLKLFKRVRLNALHLSSDSSITRNHSMSQTVVRDAYACSNHTKCHTLVET